MNDLFAALNRSDAERSRNLVDLLDGADTDDETVARLFDYTRPIRPDGLRSLLIGQVDDEVDDAETRAFVQVEPGSQHSTTFVASSLVEDRMGDVIEQTTWRSANYRRNPVILFEHDRSLVVGRGVATRKREEGATHLQIVATWDTSPLNPHGMLAAHQHANGFRNANSVGFRPGKAINRKDLPDGHAFRVADEKVPRWRAGYYFSHCELLEDSTVSVPANPEAVQLATYANEADDVDVRIQRFLDGSLASQVRDLLLDVAKNDTDFRRQVLAMTLSVPTHSGPRTLTDLLSN